MAPRKKTTLVQCLSETEDPRLGNGRRHDLVEVLVIAICAIFAQVQGFEDMAEWAQVKEPWRRRFLRLHNGIPSHDSFNRLFRILDPKHFEQEFRRWVGGVVRVVGGKASAVETRYYIATRQMSTADFAAAVRDHWGIENRLHWNLDVIFGEDKRRLTEDNAPQNFSRLTKMALNLLRQDPPPAKRRACGCGARASAGTTMRAWRSSDYCRYDVRVRSPWEYIERRAAVLWRGRPATIQASGL